MEELKIKSLPINIRPRERLIEVGASKLSDEELLAIILRTGYKDVNVKSLSSKVLTSIGNLSNFDDVNVYELSKIKGLGLTKSITILAAIEFGKRVCNYKIRKVKLNKPNIVYEYFKDIFKNKKQESFYVAYLDTQNSLIDYIELFKGTIDFISIHPREIFKNAVKLSASSFIMMHNHPSGELSPSIEDQELTDNIYDLSIMMGIKLKDHIIFSNEGYFSFKEYNMFRSN